MLQSSFGMYEDQKQNKRKIKFTGFLICFYFDYPHKQVNQHI